MLPVLKANKVMEKSKKKYRGQFFLFKNQQERDYLLEDLSVLLSSGMSVSLALAAVKNEINSKSLKRIIGEIQQEIESGSPLWKAMQDANIFSGHVISLLRIGESSGRLEQNIKVIVLQQEKERSFKSKVFSALAYPVFVLFLTFVMGIGVLWFVLPRLANVFSELRISLPLITKITVSIGVFLGKYGFIVVPPILIIVVISLYILFVREKTRYLGQGFIFKFPQVRKLMQEVEIARLGFFLGTLLQAGFPLMDCLKSLTESTTLSNYTDFYKFLSKNIDEGYSFQKTFTRYNKVNELLPVSVQQLIITAEQSGNLPESLVKIGAVYEAKTESTTQNIATMLEPVLLVIVWLGVSIIAISIILPLYSLIGGLNVSRP